MVDWLKFYNWSILLYQLRGQFCLSVNGLIRFQIWVLEFIINTTLWMCTIRNLIGSTIHSFLRCKQNKCVIPLIQPQEEIPGDWWAICKIKARSIVEVPETDVIVTPSQVPAFQENIVEIHPINPVADDGPQTLIGEDGNYLDINDAHVEEDNDQELIVESDEDEELDGDDLFDISDDD